MALEEQHDSRPTAKTEKDFSQTRIYLGDTIADFQEIGETLVIEGVRCFVTNVNIERHGGTGKWKGRVRFSAKGFPGDDGGAPGSAETRIDTDATAQMEHIDSVDWEEEQRMWTYDGEIVDNLQRTTLIGVNRETGEVAGVDVYRPAMSVTVTTTKLTTEVDNVYRRALYGAAGMTNSNAWQEWDVGELLFLGPRISRTTRGEYTDLTFHFLGRFNQFGRDVYLWKGNTGPKIVSIDVRGWQYVWFQYVTKEDVVGDQTFLGRRISAVYVATVYPSYNFDDLEITV